MRDAVEHVVVVIPAYDEQGTVAAAVTAVNVSAAELRVGVDVVVVANGCTDDTVSLARRAGARVVELDRPNVGAARAAGCAWALGRTEQVNRLWIATTDADSTVPIGWLRAHVEASRRADVLLGTIELDEVEARRHRSWTERYAQNVGAGRHDHVHGASLGVRGSAYVHAGGFHDLTAHEDVDLVDRLVATGAVLAWDSSVPVTTSARHASRVADGVGPDLAASVGPDDSATGCMKSALPGT